MTSLEEYVREFVKIYGRISTERLSRYERDDEGSTPSDRANVL